MVFSEFPCCAHVSVISGYSVYVEKKVLKSSDLSELAINLATLLFGGRWYGQSSHIVKRGEKGRFDEASWDVAMMAFFGVLGFFFV